MMRSLALGLLLSAISGPVVADCATAGLGVRCLNVGPDAGQEGVERHQTGARRIVSTGPRSKPEDRPGRFIVPPIVAGVAAHHILSYGDTLPEDGLILMNPLRYGLPRPENGWTYFKVGEDIYRAEIRSRRVLNYINPHINRY